MVQNIALTGFNRTFLKSVGKALAEKLEMFYVDTIELYEFDHLPHTMTDMLKAQGVKEFRDKEIGTIGYVTDFSNTVITFESGAVKRKKNVLKLKSRCELIYLSHDLKTVKTHLENEKYQSGLTKKFFNVPLKTLQLRDGILRKESHFVINADRKSPDMIAREIVQKLQKKYM